MIYYYNVINVKSKSKAIIGVFNTLEVGTVITWREEVYKDATSCDKWEVVSLLGSKTAEEYMNTYR